MDRKTLGLLVTEALLIVVLVVVIGMDFNKAPVEHAAAPEAAVEETAAGGEEAAAVQEEAAKETAEAKQEEAAEEKAEVKEEEKAPAKEEKPAEKAEAPAKAAGDGAVADVIALESPAYPHTKGIVQFTHKKHIDDYKVGCGECHHDESGQALKDLKMGDPVMGCIECHSKPGKAPKPAAGEKMTPEQKREYHTEALHDNCIECHKEFNKKNNTKAAAVTCAQCHPKK
ncbi:MAG: cytochrome c3 family protein [Desulfobacterales bacterium]